LRRETNHHSTGIYTLCFLEFEDKYLFIKRLKEPNSGLLNGLGGKVSRFESPEENLLREVEEESGLILDEFQLKGILRFVEGDYGKDYMVFTYLASKFHGVLKESSPEGKLQWIPKKKINTAPMVSNIPVFLPLLEQSKAPMEIHFQYFDKKPGFNCRYFLEGKKIERNYSG